MDSQNSLNNIDRPLCANGCGFYGTASTRNLCSKCYRDLLKEELLLKSSKVASSSMEKPQNPTTESISSSVLDSSTASLSLSSHENSAVSSVHVTAPVGASSAKKRCKSCKRRVGLLGFECRCGGVFCGEHRYAEKHCCTFNFKASGCEVLAKANPVCKSDKLKERI